MPKVRDHDACEEEIAALRADLAEAIAAERKRITDELKIRRLLKVPGVQRDGFDEAITIVKGQQP